MLSEAGIRLVCSDFRAFDWKSEKWDVFMTDPPYRPHVHRAAVSQSGRRGVRKRNFGFGHLSPALRSFTAQVAARTRRWILIYSDLESTNWWRIALQAAGCTYIRTIPWTRWSMAQLSGDRPPSGAEMIVLAWGTGGGSKSWAGPGNLTHLEHKCLRGEKKHKAEKALDQALDLVSWFVEPGERVFDPFMGFGTFGLASKLLGRRYLGIDCSPKCVQHSAVRIANGMRGVFLPRDAVRMRRYIQADQENAEHRYVITANDDWTELGMYSDASYALNTRGRERIVYNWIGTDYESANDRYGRILRWRNALRHRELSGI